MTLQLVSEIVEYNFVFKLLMVQPLREVLDLVLLARVGEVACVDEDVALQDHQLGVLGVRVRDAHDVQLLLVHPYKTTQ